MGFIDRIADIEISRTSRTLTRPGFGTPLFAVCHGLYADRVRSYSDLAGMVTDGLADGGAGRVSPILGRATTASGADSGVGRPSLSRSGSSTSAVPTTGRGLGERSSPDSPSV